MRHFFAIAVLVFMAYAWADMDREPHSGHFTKAMYEWAFKECGGPFKRMVMLVTRQVELTCTDGTVHLYSGRK